MLPHSSNLADIDIGAENVGTQPVAVACDFELAETYGMGHATVDTVKIGLKNDSGATLA